MGFSELRKKSGMHNILSLSTSSVSRSPFGAWMKLWKVRIESSCCPDGKSDVWLDWEEHEGSCVVADGSNG